MRIVIENQELRAEIETLGAELKTLTKKSENREYMWEGNPDFWGRTAPVLFPFIGRLEKDSFCFGEKTYQMKKHGFAREMEFSRTVCEPDRAVLSLESNAETLESFPFPFVLEVEFCLTKEGLEQQFRVHNKGLEPMYFSIGGHPAFACPPREAAEEAKCADRGTRRDCFVRLYGTEHRQACQALEVDTDTGLLTGRTFPVPTKEGIFPVTEHIFDRDALIFAGQGVTGAALLDRNGKEYVRVEAKDCPVWGIWSLPSEEAAYICIEPWWGICGANGYQGKLEQRPWVNRLEAGQTWCSSFQCTVFQ